MVNLQFNRRIFFFKNYILTVIKIGAGSFDRSLLLTIYNGENTMAHTTKKDDHKLKNPRLSILAAAHPHKIIKRLHSEQSLDDSCDGFFARFLMCNPYPVRLRLGIFYLFILLNHFMVEHDLI